MKSEKIIILRNAAREVWALTVDRSGSPPSDRGMVKHLLRRGFLTKHRSGSLKSKTSQVKITDKGRKWLNEQK